jgi:hypothetical protein
MQRLIGVTTEASFTEPRYEAAFFYGLFLRGYPLQKLREDIGVPPKVLELWNQEAMQDPGYRASVERILNYRRNVLAIFDSLVFKELVPSTSIQ